MINGMSDDTDEELRKMTRDELVRLMEEVDKDIEMLLLDDDDMGQIALMALCDMRGISKTPTHLLYTKQ
jgi:hypothetical protein